MVIPLRLIKLVYIGKLIFEEVNVFQIQHLRNFGKDLL